MIEYLRGTVLSKTPGHLVVDVAGVGYGVDVPWRPDAFYPATGEEAALYTYLYVQEQILRLYGFLTEQERAIFEVFIGTSGIGPKTAIGILSTIEIPKFASAILREEISTLVKIPGIGKKTAERLIIELRDKVKEFAASDSGARAPAAAGSAPVSREALREAAQALEALGCKPAVAERAAQRAAGILGPDADVQQLIREGLKHRY
jgi:holliday junction DNA helicase RuvA